MASSKRVQGQQHGGAPTIAQLQDAVAAAVAPIQGSAPGGFRGAPLLGSVVIDSGERSIGAASAGGEVHPAVFGGGKQVTQRAASTRRTKGASASGQQGAH
jgi:hypothetical protein